jgi:YebC/PmpR family DNA-binding regulatory protein
MAGHSHWAGIKHKKAVTDAARAKSFSKLLRAIATAARSEPNPEFNPRLRTAIAKAREGMVTADTIERALTRAQQDPENLEELLFEAYGPGGVALLVEATTDNRNRAIAEVKSTLNKNSGKLAATGSVQWSFTKSSEGIWHAQFPQEVSSEQEALLLSTLITALEELDDVQTVTTNAQ